jgi:2-methylcitrate dehydratase PrpD
MASAPEPAAADAAVGLANYTATLQYEDLPGEAVFILKRMVLDTLGTALAASGLDASCRQLVSALVVAGGVPTSTLLGYRQKVPALSAALANGAQAHALNYDDTMGPGGGHLGVVALPAALAAAEQQGGVAGRELLAALAAGTELMARLGLATKLAETGHTEAKPQPTQMPGYFSAAVSAGRVLRLGPAQMHSALGLALMQAAGGRQPVLEGVPAKALYAGFSSHGGLLSAILSREGVQAQCDLFEGEAGYFKTYYGGRYAREPLTADLGTRFYLTQVGFKPWPTTAVAHPFIEAALRLAETYGLAAEDVADVHLQGGNSIRTFCEPAATRQRPRTTVEAADSIPFPVAKALANRRLTLADLQGDGLEQPAALSLAARMRYSVDATLGSAGVVEVVTTSGQRHAVRVDHAPGHPLEPLTAAQAAAKFRDCARYAERPPSERSIEATIEMIDRLDEVPDVAQLTALLREDD